VMAITTTKPADKPVKLCDGNGLHLVIDPSGFKTFRQKYRFKGKEKLLTIGSFPKVSLADARERRDEVRRT